MDVIFRFTFMLENYGQPKHVSNYVLEIDHNVRHRRYDTQTNHVLEMQNKI